ncbi:MAG: hypothetical protein AB7P07_09455 [Hyphomonadaceae bacterium]
MAYDAGFPIEAEASASPAIAVDSFRRPERLAVLAGASAMGALAGFAAAMAIGRIDLWVVIAMAAPFLAVALHLTSETMRDALRSGAHGCATAAGLHVAALLAWPLTSLFSPVSMATFWIAPAAAISALFLLASCWQGGARGVYRTSALGLMVAAIAAHQGSMLLLGA